MRYPVIMQRAHLLGFGTAVSLIGLPLLSTFAEAAQGANPDDIASLNVAIALERAGIKAYADAAATNLLSPGVLALAGRFVADHTAHRDALIGAVRAAGATPTTETAVIPYPPLATERDIIAFANTVERKAASTYLSVVPELHDRQLAQIAAAILGVETTHVALLSEALGTKTYPSGFVV
jgi:rubrerythrin